MASFQSLYSGSSGNSSLIRDGSTALLVDMGKNCKTTINALYDTGVSAAALSGIIITHEHSDHIAGLNVFLKHHPVPLFGPDKTLEYLYCNALVPENTDLIPVEQDEEIVVGDISFSGFRTNHDSVDCFGYRFFFSNGGQAAIATDLGSISDTVSDRLRDCDFVALESNYDEGMLKFGRYPLYLKQRIASSMGHLSNFDCAETLAEIAKTDTRFMLMHLSAENNAPELALTTCLGILENFDKTGCRVDVAPRSRISDLIYI